MNRLRGLIRARRRLLNVLKGLCPSCGYAVTGLRNCPECGTPCQLLAEPGAVSKAIANYGIGSGLILSLVGVLGSLLAFVGMIFTQAIDSYALVWVPSLAGCLSAVLLVLGWSSTSFADRSPIVVSNQPKLIPPRRSFWLIVTSLLAMLAWALVAVNAIDADGIATTAGLTAYAFMSVYAFLFMVLPALLFVHLLAIETVGADRATLPHEMSVARLRRFLRHLIWMAPIGVLLMNGGCIFGFIASPTIAIACVWSAVVTFRKIEQVTISGVLAGHDSGRT